MQSIVQTIIVIVNSFLSILTGGNSTEPAIITTPSPGPSIVQPTSSPTPTLVPTVTPTYTLTPTPRPTTAPTTKAITSAPSSGYTQGAVQTRLGQFSVTVLSFDFATYKMITDTAQDSDCGNDCQTIPLMEYVTRHGGIAGVNGTYFCPADYPDCQSKKNSFDFPVYNSRLSKWIQSDKLGWSNRRAVVYQDGSGFRYQHNSAGFGGGLNAGIINYPGLIDGGNVQIDDNQSGLSDKQKAKNTKIGLGIKNGSSAMIVVARNVTMLEFAEVFKSLGATGALNLDSGGSSAVIWGGKYILGPGRNLPNAVIFARK